MGCGPGFPPERMEETSGSTGTTVTAGSNSLSAPTPNSVPPVPAPATKRSTRPLVSRKISSAVARLWRFGRIDNLLRNKGTGNLFCQLFGLVNRPLHPLETGNQHQFVAQCLKLAAAFRTHGFRHRENHTVSARRSKKASPLRRCFRWWLNIDLPRR